MTEFGKPKRIPLAREGVVTSDGRLIEPGALTWEDKYLPVLDLEGNIIGAADQIEREDGGLVTGRIRLLNGVNAVGLAAQIDTWHVNYEASEDLTEVRINDAEIHGVTLGDQPCWEGMEIDE